MVMIRTFAIVIFFATLAAGMLSFDGPETHAQAPQPAAQPAATAPVPASPAPAPIPAPAAEQVTPPAAPSVETPKPPAETPSVVTPQATPPEQPAAAAPVPAETPVIAEPPVPPVKPEEKTAQQKGGPPARELFGAKKLPAAGPPMAIGYYPRGCLQGAVQLPLNGPNWQVMRLSRNRYWGHPNLIRFVEKFAARAAKETGWPGILVGDLAQPRGGPAVSDHMSHQTGLDVDVWFVPMPKEKLSAEQREKMSAYSLVADDWKHVNPAIYTPQHAAFIKAATESPDVERVLVNAAIKKKLCETTTGDKSWLEKVRPWYGHHDHIHVRLRCPPGQANCRAQPPTPNSIGCADSDFKFWFTKALEPKKPSTKPPHLLTMAELPAECRAVLNAPAAHVSAAR